MAATDNVGSAATANGFVGRAQELEHIGALLLGPIRLITLIGAGGIGKTTLATEVARRLHKARRCPVHLARLTRVAPDSDIEAVRHEVARTVLATGFAGDVAWDSVIEALTGTGPGTILIMDNCDHVLASAGHMIDELLGAAPGLTILATSREPLGWVDEQLVVVGPLPLEHAVTLFRRRAELSGRGIDRSGQADMIERICHHLHGHPLFIRLAAARAFYEPLGMILRELGGGSADRRMHWHDGPRVGAEDRHKTVGDLIRWSYDLCSERERLLFDRMSVFAAGYDTGPTEDDSVVVGADLDAIIAVCADDPGTTRTAGGDHGDPALRPDEIRDVLEGLVRKSLVSAHFGADTVHYFLSETFRLFAGDRLRERSARHDEQPLLRAVRHCRYYHDKIMRAQAARFGPAEKQMLTWIAAESENILLAVDTSTTVPSQAEIGLELLTGLDSLRSPFIDGSVPTILRLLERTLAMSRELSPEVTDVQVRAMAQIAWIALCDGRSGYAEQMLDECVAACVPGIAAGSKWRKSPHIDIGLPPWVEFVWAMDLMEVEQDPGSAAVFSRVAEKFGERGEYGTAAMATVFAAMAAALLGSGTESVDIPRRALEHISVTASMWAKSWAELVWAISLINQGEPAEASSFVRTALRYLTSVRDVWGVIWAVRVRTWALARIITDGTADRARATVLATEIGRLLGGAITLQQQSGIAVDRVAPALQETERAIKVARDVIGDQAYAHAEKQGTRLRPRYNELQRLALGTFSIDELSPDHSTRANTPSHWHSLSSAEREVAILAAAGWPNSSIGARRGTSTKTVDAQMSSILQKLTIDSRNDIIRLLPEEGLGRVRFEEQRRPRRRG